MRTKDIAEALAGRLDGDGAIEIDRLVHPARAERPSDLALAISADAVAALACSKARAVVVSAEYPVPSGSFRAVITAGEARLALARLTALFDHGPAWEKGIHPTAIIAPDAKLGAGVSIGAYAVVGPRSRIGAGTAIMPQVTIGADVTIGAQGVLHTGVRVADRSAIGDRVIVHPNAVIGSDGFGFAPDLMSTAAFTSDVVLTRVHSLGNIVIGDDVEIGACTTVDRATIESTRIGRGTKIDNHVHIGHNVTIGESCIVCGMVGISGSVTIGDRVRLGGMTRAMDGALADAKLLAQDIQYVNAHGTGTAANDETETQALHQVFGGHAGKLAVSSTKSMVGHALGAAGALELVATILTVREAIVPPTIGYLGPDPACDLDYVPNNARAMPIEAALSNSFAFGGLNAVLAVKKFS